MAVTDVRPTVPAICDTQNKTKTKRLTAGGAAQVISVHQHRRLPVPSLGRQAYKGVCVVVCFPPHYCHTPLTLMSVSGGATHPCRAPFGQEKISTAVFQTLFYRFCWRLQHCLWHDYGISCLPTENGISLILSLGLAPERHIPCSLWHLKGVGALGSAREGAHCCAFIMERDCSAARKFYLSGASC